MRKIRRLMRPKHSLDRLLALNANGVHDLMGSFTATLPTLGCPARGPVTRFLFLRYRLQSFEVGAEILDQDGMAMYFSWSQGFITAANALLSGEGMVSDQKGKISPEQQQKLLDDICW